MNYFELLAAATLADKSRAIAECEKLEGEQPGIGWQEAADALRKLKGKSGPISRAMLASVEEVPF